VTAGDQIIRERPVIKSSAIIRDRPELRRCGAPPVHSIVRGQERCMDAWGAPIHGNTSRQAKAWELLVVALASPAVGSGHPCTHKFFLQVL